ncbi:MAG: hypothetical protein PHR33_02945 [Bacilli bacterium]|nr:hypothetical protein [Bacilli bacterium]
MKNLHKTIKQNLKAGLNVVVKDLEDDNYCAFSKTSVNYRSSGWQNSIEEAKQYIGDCYGGGSKDYWDKQDLEIVEVFRPEYEPFKVGDKVRILDSVKKTDNWGIIGKDFPDMTGEIRRVCFDTIGTNYLIDDWWIGHEYLAPLNEVKEETIKIGDHTYSKSEVEKRLQGLKEI